ncbi:unnamed protein product [Fraxinus pennsylvanica]|uniref:F-box domain-containing protein n=1 Tax=Fraxinus pennsylvanica TaxID=56036 RepID=A0AAD2E232_9LAMI|nr:unnamed protein product [Fraxinus pennsylvanica]
MAGVSDDVLLDLLSRLPVVSLVRFRCVSKSWSALIDSSYLAQLHLNKSLNDIKSRKMLAVRRVCDWNNVGRDIFYAISFDLGFKFSDVQEIEPPVRYLQTRMSFIGSCRFLICLRYQFDRYDYEKIVLWNPSARSHRILPFIPVEIEASQDTKDRPYTFSYGFGYDNVMDDYNVVRLVFDDENGDCEVKVYSLKLDTWKKIEKVSLRVLDVSRPSFANGSMSWIVRERKLSNSTFSLLSLCLRTEVFQLASLPKDLIPGLDFSYVCCHYLNYCCYCSDWTYKGYYHRFSDDHDLWNIMDCENSDIWTKLRLPISDGEEGMGASEIYQQQLKESLLKKLLSEFQSLQKNPKYMTIFPEDRCSWIDSLVRVERSNNKSKK